ncbi:MAG: hypothetical protein J5516_08445 [Bacteroidales bacterium]|nr:hypothetical protein [Bacteroidales bacterium]
MKKKIKNRSKDKRADVEGRKIYETFAELARLQELYNADKAAYQKMAMEWDMEDRRKRKAMLQNYSFRSLGEGMVLVQQNQMGWNKPRFLLDKINKTGVEFMDDSLQLRTIQLEDINWQSMKGLPEGATSMARSLSGYYPVLITKYERGCAEVIWTLNPDGMYYMDEDGFGMETGEEGVEVKMIGYIDRNGTVVRKFNCYK